MKEDLDACRKRIHDVRDVASVVVLVGRRVAAGVGRRCNQVVFVAACGRERTFAIGRGTTEEGVLRDVSEAPRWDDSTGWSDDFPRGGTYTSKYAEISGICPIPRTDSLAFVQEERIRVYGFDLWSERIKVSSQLLLVFAAR